MKWMIVSALAFGISSAAAAGYVAIQSSKATVEAESDSAQVVVESPDPETQHDEPVDSVTADPDTSQVEIGRDTIAPDSIVHSPEPRCPTPEEASAAPPAMVPEPVEPDPEAQRQAYRQVARILSNMGDVEVAQLLAHIEDEEIEVILRNVTAREGARILSQLSGERAADLSRRLLVAVTN